MRPCYTCGAPNPDDKTACYSCGQSLVSPSPMPGQAPPAANPYPPQHVPQQPYAQQQQYQPQQYPQQYAPQQYPPQQPAHQQYPSQAYAPQVPAMSQGYAPQPSYPSQPGAAPYAQAQYPAQLHVQVNYPPQAYGQPPYAQGYAQPFPPGMAPQQMPAVLPGFNPAEQIRAEQIKAEYRTIARRCLLALLVTIVSAFMIAFAFKDQQTIFGLPRIVWVLLPVVGLLVFCAGICRCPGCKASLMLHSEINETGQCPFCDAQLK